MNFIKIQPHFEMKMQQYLNKNFNPDLSYGLEGKIGYKGACLNKTGHWNEKQNAKYFTFLKKFKQKFQEKQSRRQWKVFKALSQFVETRNANQCRSHHHKMQKNFQTIEEALDYMRKKIPTLQKKCQKYTEQLEKIAQKIFTQGGVERSQKLASQITLRDSFISPHSIPPNQQPNQAATNKKFDIGNLRTRLDQEDQQNAINNQPISCFFGPQENGQQFFPSTGLFTNLTPSNNTYNGFPPPQHFSIQNIQYYSQVLLTNYEKSLFECQQIFIQWYNKVHTLISQEQGTLHKKYFPNQLIKHEYFDLY